MNQIARKIEIEAEATKALLANVRDVIGDDDDLAMTAIEGETNLIEALDAAVRRVQEIEVFRDAIDEQIKKLGERSARFERQSEHIRQAILVAMGQADIRTLELATATVSRKRAPPKLTIINEADIPPQFWKPSDPKLDRRALTDALKDAQPVPGATLSNGGETLSIGGN